MKQIKPFLSYDGQIDRLMAHGCKIEDKQFAQTVLSRVNYYHAEQYGPLGYIDNTAFRAKGHDHAVYAKS